MTYGGELKTSYYMYTAGNQLNINAKELQTTDGRPMTYIANVYLSSRSLKSSDRSWEQRACGKRDAPGKYSK